MLVFAGFLVMDLFMAYQINLRYQNDQATKMSLKLAALRPRALKRRSRKICCWYMGQPIIFPSGSCSWQAARSPAGSHIIHFPLNNIFSACENRPKKDGRSFFGETFFY
jgi:hypothetical protein